MKNKVERIQGIAQPKNIVLENERKLRPYERWMEEVNKAELGIYEGSECVVVNVSSDRFYQSGRTRRYSASVSIPLSETEILVSLRDLLDEAVKMSKDYQDGSNHPANLWSAGIFRSHNDPRFGWNHFLSIKASSEEEAREIATTVLSAQWDSRRLWDAWVDGGKHVRSRRDLLEGGTITRITADKIGDVLCPSCREPVDIDEWHTNAGVCVSCHIDRVERGLDQIEADSPGDDPHLIDFEAEERKAGLNRGRP